MSEEAAPNEQLALQVQEVRAELALLAEQVQSLQADVARLAPSNGDDQGDVLVTLREGAVVVDVPYSTICRWANQNPEALGVKRIGGKIHVSQRRLRFFARRRLTKF
jgi:hypothetical protein